MKTLKFPSFTVQMYDSVEDMPVRVWHRFVEYMILGSVGSSVDEIERHLALMVKFHKDGDEAAFASAANAMAMAINFVKQGFHPKLYAFCILLKDLQGLDDGSIQQYADAFYANAPISAKAVSNHIDQVVTNIRRQLAVFFADVPAIVVDETKAYYANIRAKAGYWLDAVINDTDNAASIAEMDKKINEILKPLEVSPLDPLSHFTMTKKAQTEMELSVEKEYGSNDERTLLQFMTIIAEKIKKKPND